MEQLSICDGQRSTNSASREESPPFPRRTTPPRRLPELYYLTNFKTALASLHERYADLLGEEESDFITKFGALSQATQCLLTRMLLRKGPTLRRNSLDYPEVADPATALQDLAALGWVELDPRVDLDELFRLLGPAEWRRTFGQRARRLPAGAGQHQLALELPGSLSVARTLSQWHRRLTDSHVHLAIEPAARRLQFLYFGNDHQSWAEFVMADLGLQKYERVAYGSNSRAFGTRAEIADFYRLNDCRALLRNGSPATVVAVNAQPPHQTTDWLRARFAKLQLQLGQRFENEGDHDRAVQAYRDCATVEAHIRIVRLHERIGLHEAAFEAVQAILDLPATEAERQLIDRALARLNRRLGKTSNPAAVRHKPEIVNMAVPLPLQNECVERRVCSLLATHTRPAFYVENALFPSLFGLLCWDAVFAPIPGAFFHPFQSGPADLYGPDFKHHRKHLLAMQLAQLGTGEYKKVIWQNFREKAGTSSVFVRWGSVTPEVLSLSLQCIPANHLKLIFERLLEDLGNNCSGLPDLIHFNPGEGSYRLVEVKAPGDRLQDNQRRWMDFFRCHGIPAVVCRVSWDEAGDALPCQSMPTYVQ